MTDKTKHRTVLFLTTLANDDIPQQEPSLACLLPFGHATFIERTLESLASAGIKHLDLVICEHSEKLRALLDDGWRWGLVLTWHLARDTTTPYDIIPRIGKLQNTRLLIGHAHRWIDASGIGQLMQQERVAMMPKPHRDWSGWMSVNSQQAMQISPHIDEDSLAQWAQTIDNEQRLQLKDGEFACACDVRSLHQAQYVALSQLQNIPATWVRHPWGAASPEALIHADAIIQGPVLVGPGCSIGRGARIGPGVVLSSDVLVSGGATVQHSLLLPNSYVSADVSLEQMVVQGNTFADLKWEVKSRLPVNEGWLDTLRQRDTVTPPLSSRLLALGVIILGLPLMALLVEWQMWHGREAPWVRKSVVTGKDEEGKLQLSPLRTKIVGSGSCGWLLGMYGGVLDIVQGRRHWLGIRPRDAAEWYALRKHWQTLFANKPIGLLNAPEWHDDPSHHSTDAQAAADAYLIVKSGWQDRLRVLLNIVSQFSLREKSK